jgi:hypothetical protein
VDSGLIGTKLNAQNISLGCRVRRGPNWRKKAQDGGAGNLGTVTAYKLMEGGSEGLEGLSPKGMRKIHTFSAVVKWHKTKLWCFYALGDLELVESEQERHRSTQRRKTEGSLPGAAAVLAAASTATAHGAKDRRSTDLPVAGFGSSPQAATEALAEENEFASDSDEEDEDFESGAGGATSANDAQDGGVEAGDDATAGGDGEAGGGDWV